MSATRVSTTTADGRLSARDVAKFTAMVALFAIFFDAVVGHGLSWENDPYWTYWITKTFLIATIFGLGTAWFGIGEARGAAITVVHTVVLTVYYWSLSPIGLPASPDWLDLEHTWVTGVPIHFGVIFLGYLTALWLWRRRAVVREAAMAADSGPLALNALIAGVAILVLAGALSNVALGEFSGVTWYVVRLLITVPFLMAWWVVAGRDRVAAVTGGVVLAFMWAAYSQFLGPIGLPDTPIRVFTQAPPPATVRWLDYKELWLISLPIYLIVMVAVLLLDSRRATAGGSWRGPAVTAAAVAAVLLTSAATIGPSDQGTTATVSATGAVQVETGAFYSDTFTAGNGDIRIFARDQGGRVTPLPPHDELHVDATIDSGGHTFVVTVRQAMVEHPLGMHTTWWGVGFDVDHHGNSGIGTSRLPNIHSELAAFGVGSVTMDGRSIANGVPVHVMTAVEGLPGGAHLELDVGAEEFGPVVGLPDGHLRVEWASYTGGVSEGPKRARYAVGVVVLILLLLAALSLNRREVRAT